jgi:hypothetical protein
LFEMERIDGGMDMAMDYMRQRSADLRLVRSLAFVVFGTWFFT